MAGEPGTFDIQTLTTPGEELRPPISTYIVRAPGKTVVIDPGPDTHVHRHIKEITAAVDPDDGLFVIVQSPLAGSLSGIDRLAALATRRAIVLHWAAASTAGQLLNSWNVRPVAGTRATIPLSEERQILVAGPTSGVPVGTLISFDTGSRTLFSGPLFGSLGEGAGSDRPLLRRESVRAYSDAYTPNIEQHAAWLAFGRELSLTHIAPAYGKMAVGGRSLIQTVFEEERKDDPVSWAFYRLYIRVAALAGETAAKGAYQATGLAPPDLESGYRASSDVARASLTGESWASLCGRIEQWLSKSVQAALLPLIADLSVASGLPIPKAAEHIATGRRTGTSEDSASREPGEQSGGQPNGSTHEARPQVSTVQGAVQRSAGGETTGFDALTDPATGLMNHTVFRQRLASQISGSAESENDDEDPAGSLGKGSVAFLSIDDLRRINATYGRTGGEEALHVVAYLLGNFHSAHSRRGAHRLYRVSGPNFAYVLSTGSVVDGAALGEQIRQNIAESAMFLERLTVSVGVVGIDELPPEFDREPVDELERIGLARVRVARQSGMNTVCAEDPEHATAVSSGASVLVADPDAPYLEMLTKRLDEQGFTTIVARDGSEALDITTQFAPDAIVSEVMLSKQNGFAFREELRHSALLSRIPFILVSHKKTDEMIEKAAHLGIVHFLRKPFSLTELVGLLQNLTRGGE